MGNATASDHRNVASPMSLAAPPTEAAPTELPPVLERKWNAFSQQDPSFSFMSYNILAPVWASPYNYSYLPPWAVNWNWRRALILKEVEHLLPDVVCMQEVDEKSFTSALLAGMKVLGYDGYHSPNNSTEGVATFWKTAKFKCLDQLNGTFNPLATEKFEQLVEETTEKVIYGRMSKISHHNAFAISLLEHLGTGRRVVVANTHLWWGYGSYELNWQLQCLQMPLLLDQIAIMKQKTSQSSSSSSSSVDNNKCGVLLCGDFNATPESGVYEFLTKGNLSRAHKELTLMNKVAPISNDIKMSISDTLQSCYGASPQGEPKYTTATLAFAKCIDYIFYSTEHLEPTAVLGVLEKGQFAATKALPSKDYGSDHISIMAKLRFK